MSFLRRLLDYFAGQPENSSSGPKKRDSLDVAAAAWGRIVIIVSHEKNGWAIESVRWFIRTLQERIGNRLMPEIDVLYANNDAVYMAQNILEPLRVAHESGDRCELIVTIGGWCSREVRDVLDTWSEKIPQLFCAVPDPLRLALVDSLAEPGGMVSGVMLGTVDFGEVLRLLHAVCPDNKKILVPYSELDVELTGSGEEVAYLEALRVAGDQYGMQICPLRTDVSGAWRQQLTAEVAAVDMVMLLPDSLMIAAADELIAAVNAANKPLCAADLCSVYRGAAFGFGDAGDVYGTCVAVMAYELLIGKGDLKTVSVIQPQATSLVRFNREAMRQQGVQLSHQAWALLELENVFR